MTEQEAPRRRPAPAGGTVRILPADVRLGVRGGETIVDAVRRHGYRTRYSCRRGGCGLCKADLVTGELTYSTPVADSVLTPAERRRGRCLPCRAHPVGDVAIRLGDGDELRNVLGTLLTPTTTHDTDGQEQR
jgi:CDP-4-dehydro-6-deoxyglucose reductase